MSIPEISAWTGNIYLWDKIVAEGNCWHWIITKNTILFVPFTEDLTDHWPNEFALTNTWVQLVQNQANVKVWYFNWSSYLSWANSSKIDFWDFHIWAWLKMSQINRNQFIFAWTSNWGMFFWYDTVEWYWIGRNGIAWDSKTSYSFSTNTWYYLSVNREWSTLKLLLNWSVLNTYTNNINYKSNWSYRIWDDWTSKYVTWYISNLIIENKWWSTDEETDYFNWNKWKYGL